MLTSKRNVIAISSLLIITFATLTATLWLPFTPSYIDPEQRLLAPSSTHWFGTDNFGRDIFARTIVAAKISLFVGAVVALISTSIGTVIGIVSGYYRKADFVWRRLIAGFLAFPYWFLLLPLLAVLAETLTIIFIPLPFDFIQLWHGFFVW